MLAFSLCFSWPETGGILRHWHEGGRHNFLVAQWMLKVNKEGVLLVVISHPFCCSVFTPSHNQSLHDHLWEYYQGWKSEKSLYLQWTIPRRNLGNDHILEAKVKLLSANLGSMQKLKPIVLRVLYKLQHPTSWDHAHLSNKNILSTILKPTTSPPTS